MEVRNCFYKVLKLLIGKHWMVGLSYINLAFRKDKMIQLTAQERIWICIQMGETSKYSCSATFMAATMARSRSTSPNNHNKKFSKISSTWYQLEYEQRQQWEEKNRKNSSEHQKSSSTFDGLGIPKSSFSRIIRKDLNFHPYVLIRRQKLCTTDPAQRLAFCQRFLNMNTQDPQFLDNLSSF